MSDKFILDACCGGKHFWFDKTHPNAIYMDIRSVEKGTIKVQPNWSCDPDVIGSYTEMPFEDESFNLVVWDIPHKLKFDTGLITTKYGSLGNTWREDCKKGFDEIFRISFVLYYRQNMFKCSPPTEQLEELKQKYHGYLKL